MADSNVWNDFWINSPDSDHQKEEAQVVADEFIRRYVRTGKETVLDFGCGYGHVAEAIADWVEKVYIWDQAAPALTAARARIRRADVITIDPYDEEDHRPLANFILVNSVIQYMTREELDFWLAKWVSWLKYTGCIVLSDVIIEPNRLWTDTVKWWLFAARRGVLRSAITFSLKSARRYRRTRRGNPIESVNPHEIDTLGRRVGLQLKRIEDNLGYQRSRRTLILSRLID